MGFIDILSETAGMQDRHGNPLLSRVALDSIAIDKTVFCILDIIQQHEQITMVDFIEIPEPRYKIGLMNCNNHYAQITCLRVFTT